MPEEKRIVQSYCEYELLANPSVEGGISQKNGLENERRKGIHFRFNMAATVKKSVVSLF